MVPPYQSVDANSPRLICLFSGSVRYRRVANAGSGRDEGVDPVPADTDRGLWLGPELRGLRPARVGLVLLQAVDRAVLAAVSQRPGAQIGMGPLNNRVGTEGLPRSRASPGARR